MSRSLIAASLGLAGLALSGCVPPPPGAVSPYDTGYSGGYADPYYADSGYYDPYYSDPYYAGSYGYTPYPVVGSSSVYFNYVDRDNDRGRHRGNGHRDRRHDGNRGSRRSDTPRGKRRDRPVEDAGSNRGRRHDDGRARGNRGNPAAVRRYEPREPYVPGPGELPDQYLNIK